LKEHIELEGGRLLDAGSDVAVDVERRGDAGVPEALLRLEKANPANEVKLSHQEGWLSGTIRVAVISHWEGGEAVSFFRGLQQIFQPKEKPVPEAPAEVSAKVFKGRDRRVEIVGEGSYQSELARIAGPKTENGVNVYKVAQLVPEPTNRQDRHAVAAKIDGIVVGYLSRAQAQAYHRALTDSGHAGEAVVDFRVRIHGAWKRPGGDEGHYGVTLLLPESLAEVIGFETNY
jgi:hypothetical protein